MGALGPLAVAAFYWLAFPALEYNVPPLLYQFSVEFGLVLCLLYFIVGTLAGALFYYQRIILGSAFVGAGLLLGAILVWLL